MKIHHLRNATFIIESGKNYIIVDPMLSEKGKLPPFALFRHKPRFNPTVSLPDNALHILPKVTHCLITHSHTFGLKALQHTDHLDADGELFLKQNNIPVICREDDANYLKKYGINVITSLYYWESKELSEELKGIKITAIPAKHGHGWIHKFMANGAGFYIEIQNEPSIYISGDTVYTQDVERVLTEFKPNIAVVAAGSASLDVGGSILMPLEEIIKFIQKAPNRVILNHLEALNHCPTTRNQLKLILQDKVLLSKVYIPDDGEILNFDTL
ncbi:MAG: MBL fold metallo-hydrolase [Desulfamplus sp.]|nr:MBL fold metallo-hydrolase [Desulfamplus sp.]